MHFYKNKFFHGLRNLFLCILFCSLYKSIYSQTSNQRSLFISSKQDTIQLDSLTIYPNSLKIVCLNSGYYFTKNEYEIDFKKNKLILFNQCSDSIKIEYRVLPIALNKVYGNRDTSKIYDVNKGDWEDYLFENTYSSNDIFSGTGINKTGSISRGISFGNNQNLSVNSSMNLEMSGDLAPNLKILASVSDDNLPIQADGNTNKLQEFDQIFIQVYNDRFKIIAGDFWLKKPKGYFLNYNKRVQGLTAEYQWGKDSSHVWKNQVSGAISKGKFNRQIVQGIEGNQGPYRLTGNENEPFIIVLAGTENVFIDGKLLKRGQEFDYTINYNTSEITFTSRNQITKDSRIVVEFQYTAQNYTRSLFQTATSYKTEKFDFWLNTYSEQDLKNQPLQQDLTFAQKQYLATIGDNLSEARMLSIDSIGFLDNQNLYALVDSMGYDSVLVFSVNKDSALYKATFQFVGAGKGDYVLEKYGAFGKIYRWVAPINGVPQGDYGPYRLIYTPKKQQMISSGYSYKILPKLISESEFSTSKNDLNTFSTLNSNDDDAVAFRTKLLGIIPLDKSKKWELEPKFEIETLGKNFQPIQQYRAVEFDRDWNTRNKGYIGDQLLTTGGLNFKQKEFGNINVEAQRFTIGSDYEGQKMKTNGRWNNNSLSTSWEGSALSSKGTNSNEFIRHKIDIAKTIRKVQIGYKDDHEINKFRADNILQNTSYQFFDYQFYLTNKDTSGTTYKLYYRERYDQKSDSTKLSPAAQANTVGGELKIANFRNQNLTIITNYRELKIKDSTLMNQAPENTLVGRIEYDVKTLKGAVQWDHFYEIGSGLELKKEIVYIKVNDGQGVYTWIDYNNDGVKDLNEFEIAQYADQASYVRIFSPSNTYIKTFSNELNEGIFLKPEKLLAKRKGKLATFIARFSDQGRVRIARKTNQFNGIEILNPIQSTIADSELISTSYNTKNTLFFNRNSTIFGLQLSNVDNRSKSLLASGFDSRQTKYYEISSRLNIKRIITLETMYQNGIKVSMVDYTQGRNYRLKYDLVKPSIIFQPSTSFRVSLDARYSMKRNDKIFGGESSEVKELGSTFKYNQAEKGSLQGNFSVLNIAYSGNQNSPLGFEMLEALTPGINYVWGLSYQRSVSKKLQISMQYTGRRISGNRTIHTGGMEVRAFF